MGINDSLRCAYLNTTYRVNSDHEGIDIRIGAPTATLDQLLQMHGVAEWAFITASNPGSRLLDDQQNMDRNAELALALRDTGLHFLDGVGVPDMPDWQPERSYLILGITMADAISIARRWGQSAIVWGSIGVVPQLLEIE